MADYKKVKPHIYLGRTGTPESYTSPASGGSTTPEIPSRNRQQHGNALMGQLQAVSYRQAELVDEAADHDLESVIGIQVEFENFPGVELAVESLADARGRIELLNVKHSDDRTSATIFVPDGKLTTIEKKLQDYIEYKVDSAGRPRDNRKLIDAIGNFRVAALDALWTDYRELELPR